MLSLATTLVSVITKGPSKRAPCLCPRLCLRYGSVLITGERIRNNWWLAMVGKILKEAIQASEQETPFDDANLNVVGC